MSPIAILIAALCLVGPAFGQSQQAAANRASSGNAANTAIKVRSVTLEQTEDGLAVAILSNGALVPSITKLDGPPRLVVDLAGAVNAVPRARITAKDGAVKSIRVSQFQQSPPLTRVVVDLSEPRDYGWETVQNKLLLHLRKPGESANPGSSAPAFTTGVEPAITYGGNAPAAVQQVEQLTSGPSSVTASEETTILNLARGGQIKVCPGTTVSVTSSDDRRDVMVGMSTGSFETHYGLVDSADSVLTPDFRILLPGPGQFDLAISADSRGNTCVRSLPGNTASAVVSELMGEGMYQVKPDEQVVFHNGQVGKADHNVPIDCGCPATQTPILRTEAAPPPAPPQAASNGGSTGSGAPDLAPPSAGDDSGGVAVRMAVTAPEMAAAPKPGQVHMQVEAPLVFRGNEPMPDPTEEAQKKLPVMSSPPESLSVSPLPPPQTPPAPPAKERSGFFGKFKHFLSSVFG